LGNWDFRWVRLSLFFETCEGHAESIEFCGRRLVLGAGKDIHLLALSYSFSPIWAGIPNRSWFLKDRLTRVVVAGNAEGDFLAKFFGSH